MGAQRLSWWARLVLDRTYKPLTTQGTAYDNHMNPETFFQSGSGDFTDANQILPCLLVIKSSLRVWGGLRNSSK